MKEFDINAVKTPCYVVDERLLEKNMKILRGVAEKTGCKVLLAQKAFSMYSTYPLMSEYLDGTTASGLYEAELGYEEMPSKEVHIFSPAYRPDHFERITEICGHILFNSFEQVRRFMPAVNRARAAGKHIECGIRVNPEYSEIETDIYNPCAGASRLGVRVEGFEEGVKAGLLEGISGLHFHTMCEQNSDVLQRTIPHFEEKFGKYLSEMKWVNFGGGHHVTRDDYDVDLLCSVITDFRERHNNIDVYIEPGEAAALNAGWLVTEVLEAWTSRGVNHIIVDASAACHMPDVLEMPYRPNIVGSGLAGEKAYTCRLGAATCLAGDIIGDYSFDEPLKSGDRLVFCDMAIYSMCKNNTFNGIGLPHIYRIDRHGKMTVHKEFGYEDFKIRL